MDDLTRQYTLAIEKPIINSTEIKSDAETISLRFPRIVDAFVPQSYKFLYYNDKKIHLEAESIWRDLPLHHDLDKFIIKYLYSPDGIEYPLLILGHPGSGKSLLTEVLSAQLMSNSFTVIRIPLREVNADAGIDVLVEDQIKKLTNRPLSQGYGGFAAQFYEKPLTIILDGYDELLQAKGDVFSGYLEKARIFQQDQKGLNRPVRVIITSRITLIDKARVPINSTILRLMEFDQDQQQAWIDIWNKTNYEYFAESGIKPFNLIMHNKGGKNSLLELAEQPLLLLMLAIYDSESNELAETSDIKRTELYDNLIRRFIRRERGRYVPGFIDKTADEQEIIIEQEMNRLGVIAIGMYNRRGVVIRSKQLEDDLNRFQAHRFDGSPRPNTLQESESLLGGFFFIHKSTAQDLDAHSNHAESAYEFLHNTFGEFLAAYFILYNTIREVRDIYVDRTFKSASFENKYSNPDSINPGWLFCLMFVPLYSRPVVIEMLREHAKKALEQASILYDRKITITYSEFVENLKFIVQDQLKMILNTRNTPGIMRNGILFDRDIPLLGYLSTYSINLITLVCAISPDGFEFDEEKYHNSEVSKLDSKPWDKLTALWKAWFSSADLVGLSVVLRANRKSDTAVNILCNEKFEATRYEQPIDILLCISSTLADNMLTGLAGLQTQRFNEITHMNEEEVCNMLDELDPDLAFSYMINILRRLINSISTGGASIINLFHMINGLILKLINDDNLYNINQDSLLNLFSTIECCLQRKILFAHTRRSLLNKLPHLAEKRDSLQANSNLPERSALAQVLRLLGSISESPVIFYEHFSRNLLLDSDWIREIDQTLHFPSNHTNGSKWFIRYIEMDESQQIRFFDTIQKSPIIDEKRYARILRQFTKQENMEILLETKPELLSRAILIMLIRGPIISNLDSNTISFFLDGCLEQLKTVGIVNFGFTATLNSIKIARYSQRTSYLSESCNIIKEWLFGTHPSTFSRVVYLYPSFVAELIEVMPELFENGVPDMFDIFPHEYNSGYFMLERWLDYIKVLRGLNGITDNNTGYNIQAKSSLHRLNSILRKNIIPRIDRIDHLTISQLNDILWYASITNDENLSVMVKEKLRQFKC